MITRRIGVDFGTSSSVVCYRDYDGVKELESQEISFDDWGSRYTPTLIWEDDARKEPLFGMRALSTGKQPEKRKGLRSSFKMGLLSNDSQRRAEAETLAGLFFGYLFDKYDKGCRNSADRAIDREETVVTCPGKFDESAREALHRAIEQTKFKNVKIINEAEAALRYVLAMPTNEVLDAFNAISGPLVVMLLDMGAGTSDIAVYRCDGINGERQLLANYPTDDASTFGGDELDEYLCGFYESVFGNNLCKQIGYGKPTIGRLLFLDHVKEFKEHELSPNLNRGYAVSNVPGVIFYTDCGRNPDYQAAAHLDRAVLEGLLSEYLPQLTNLVEGALEKAGVKAGDVGLVILTGAHSKWYFVRDCLKAAGITAPVVSDPDPRLVVARGATLVWKEHVVTTVPSDSEPKLTVPNEAESVVTTDVDMVRRARKCLGNAKAGGLLFIEDKAEIKGRGTVVTGRIGGIGDKSIVRLDRGQYVHLLRKEYAEGAWKSPKVAGIEIGRKTCDCANDGDAVGLLLEDVEKWEVAAGDVLVWECYPENAEYHNAVKAASDDIGRDASLVPDVPVQPGFAYYTWAELKKLSRAIAAANSDVKWLEIAKEYHLVDANGKLRGDTKGIMLKDKTRSSVRILGFRHDNLARGSTGGITFEFADIPEMHRMNPEKRGILFKYSTNCGGWEESDMRRWLNDNFYALLPDDLRECVEPAKKRANNRGEVKTGDTSCVTETTDILWLLSTSEVYGRLSSQMRNVPWSSATYDAEGIQYKLYADQGVTTSDYGFCKKSGASSWWWLRSPGAYGEYGFRVVGHGGGWGYDLAGSVLGVSPGFCF